MPNKRIGRRGTAAIPGQKRSPNRPPRSVLIPSRCPNFEFPAVLIRLSPPADLKFPEVTASRRPSPRPSCVHHPSIPSILQGVHPTIPYTRGWMDAVGHTSIPLLHGLLSLT